MKISKFNHINNCPQFYIATILDWKPLLKPETYKLILIESLQFLVNEKRVILHGYVIMDNHIHLIWSPTKLFSLKHTQFCFMKFTAQRLKRELELNHPEILIEYLVNLKDRTFQFWQRNPLCIDLYNIQTSIQKLKYIHKNPVKAGYCDSSTDYRFSSAKFYKGMGDEFGILIRLEDAF